MPLSHLPPCRPAAGDPEVEAAVPVDHLQAVAAPAAQLHPVPPRDPLELVHSLQIYLHLHNIYIIYTAIMTPHLDTATEQYSLQQMQVLIFSVAQNLLDMFW